MKKQKKFVAICYHLLYLPCQVIIGIFFKRIISPNLICHLLIFLFNKLIIISIFQCSCQKLAYYILFQIKCPSKSLISNSSQTLKSVPDTDNLAVSVLLSNHRPPPPPLWHLAIQEIPFNLLQHLYSNICISLSEEKKFFW